MEQHIQFNFKKDDVITIAYSREGVYRVTINKTANDGTKYLNEEHSKDALNFTFTEKDLDADGAIRIPVIHTKKRISFNKYGDKWYNFSRNNRQP